MQAMVVGLVGCGVISEIYLKNLTTQFLGVRVKCCADAFREKSDQRAVQFGIQSVSVEQLLADPEIQVVLNLTNPASHIEVSLAALQAGKHVYSEKPLAMTLSDGRKILKLAKEKGLQVGCAPDTFLGAGLQTALTAIAAGKIGRPVGATAFYTCRGHERWHASPAFYYQQGGGPHMDMGPYYITTLIAALGRVKRVVAMSGRAFSTRVFGEGSKKGETFPVEVDTQYTACLEFQSGCIATVLFSFDIWATNLPKLEIYGTDGSLSLPDPNFFAGPVSLKESDAEAFTPLSLVSTLEENLRGLGLAQMCKAISEGGTVLASAQLALHVLEVLLAMEESSKSGCAVICEADCSCPDLLTFGRL